MDTIFSKWMKRKYPSTYRSLGDHTDEDQEPIEIDPDVDREEELAAKQLKKAGFLNYMQMTCPVPLLLKWWTLN